MLVYRNVIGENELIIPGKEFNTKTFTVKINIKDISGEIPYSSNATSYTSRWYVYGSEVTINKDEYFKITDPQVG